MQISILYNFIIRWVYAEQCNGCAVQAYYYFLGVIQQTQQRAQMALQIKWFASMAQTLLSNEDWFISLA
jgi:hypothetical protein